MRGRRQLELCGVIAVSMWLTACPQSVRPPVTGNVPACGPTLARQQITFSVGGTEPLPPIRDVTWTIRTHCLRPSGRTAFVDHRFITVLQIPRGDFVLNPADGFEGLGLGRIIEHFERPDTVSFTLANAAQANWCIEGVVRFAGPAAPPDLPFGPVTARQVAGTSPFLLNFIGTRDASGAITVAPGFSGAMSGCVAE